MSSRVRSPRSVAGSAPPNARATSSNASDERRCPSSSADSEPAPREPLRTMPDVSTKRSVAYTDFFDSCSFVRTSTRSSGTGTTAWLLLPGAAPSSAVSAVKIVLLPAPGSPAMPTFFMSDRSSTGALDRQVLAWLRRRRERLAHDPVAVGVEARGLLVRVDDPDAIGHLQAGLFAHVLDLPDEVARVAFERELGRDLGVERNGEPVAVHDGEAFARARPDLELAGGKDPLADLQLAVRALVLAFA